MVEWVLENEEEVRACLICAGCWCIYLALFQSIWILQPGVYKVK